jgi:hypothetical protein
MGRLEGIRKRLGRKAAGSVVLIALDGENCWEFYDRGGDAFLSELYDTLERSKTIRTVCLSEVLEDVGRAPRLDRVYPASWIGGSFRTWIGSPQDNAAWEMLAGARAELRVREEGLAEERRRAAWRCVHAAEGSDWFWWYGEDHSTSDDPEFDALFRAHIRKIYENAGMEVPSAVLRPIMVKRSRVAIPFEPAAVIHPILDGRVTTFYEWKLAGIYESYREGSKMVSGERVVDAIHFGFDHRHLYLRLDTGISPQSPEFTDFRFTVELDAPVRKEFSIAAPDPAGLHARDLEVRPEEEGEYIRAVALEIAEIAIPFDRIPVQPGEELAFRVSVWSADRMIERRPIHDSITLRVPRPDFEAEMWSAL